jgi:citrate lyase subunit alpha/citrate CoA-transferase
LEKLQGSKLKLVPIEELFRLALSYTGVPEEKKRSGRVIGVVRYRDQTLIDTLYQM